MSWQRHGGAGHARHLRHNLLSRVAQRAHGFGRLRVGGFNHKAHHIAFDGQRAHHIVVNQAAPVGQLHPRQFCFDLIGGYGHLRPLSVLQETSHVPAKVQGARDDLPQF